MLIICHEKHFDIHREEKEGNWYIWNILINTAVRVSPYSGAVKFNTETATFTIFLFILPVNTNMV